MPKNISSENKNACFFRNLLDLCHYLIGRIAASDLINITNISGFRLGFLKRFTFSHKFPIKGKNKKSYLQTR